MKSLEQVLAAKVHGVISVEADAMVFQALTLMAQHDIGALLVLEGGKPVGIFSERDYARKVILLGKASKDTPVRDVMSEKVLFVTPSQTVEECMAIMTDHRVRHLPVAAENGAVVGVLSIGDLVKEVISEQSFIIGQLEHYITHG
jgi:CBS domain-containing protein